MWSGEGVCTRLSVASYNTSQTSRALHSLSTPCTISICEDVNLRRWNNWSCKREKEAENKAISALPCKHISQLTLPAGNNKVPSIYIYLPMWMTHTRKIFYLDHSLRLSWMIALAEKLCTKTHATFHCILCASYSASDLLLVHSNLHYRLIYCVSWRIPSNQSLTLHSLSSSHCLPILFIKTANRPGRRGVWAGQQAAGRHRCASRPHWVSSMDTLT